MQLIAAVVLWCIVTASQMIMQGCQQRPEVSTVFGFPVSSSGAHCILSCTICHSYKKPGYTDLWCSPGLHMNCTQCICLTCTAVPRKTRRKRNATLFFIEGAVQWLNLVFWVTPNMYLVVKPCYFLSHVVFWCGWVRWTCWNTVRLCNGCPAQCCTVMLLFLVCILYCTQRTIAYHQCKLLQGNNPKGASWHRVNALIKDHTFVKACIA